MEDLILETLDQNPGMTPGQLFMVLPGGVDLDGWRLAIFRVFRVVSLDDSGLLSAWMLLEELALLLDQLIDLALCRVGRGVVRVREDGDV